MILASNNAHKLEEFRAIFADMGIEIIPQSAAGCHFEVDETGETFEENAYLKAIAVTRATGQPAVADDSGLMVDALGGAPGVHSARYTGRHEDSDAARYTLLLHNLGDRTDRTARFVSCICCTFPNGDVLRARGTCEGSILFAPRGENGFGPRVSAGRLCLLHGGAAPGREKRHFPPRECAQNPERRIEELLC